MLAQVYISYMLEYIWYVYVGVWKLNETYEVSLSAFQIIYVQYTFVEVYEYLYVLAVSG